ncbi:MULTISPECIES: hypothetical protein [Hyphobacterium]|uniref:Uncharacterized protein n=1 Tax=Hyphobacterium vulgare TaxID=1736751 RepID=A0ABV6ZY03_9PROT
MNERENHAAGERERFNNMNAAYNQYGGAHGSGGLSGGDPLTGLLWLVFVLPFKIVIWLFKALFWMLTTWIGRGVLVLLLILSVVVWWRLDMIARASDERYAALLALTDADFTERATLTLTVTPGTVFAKENGEPVTIRCTIELAPYGDDYFTRYGSDCASQTASGEFTRWRGHQRRHDDPRFAPGFNYLHSAPRRESDPPDFVADGTPTLRWMRLHLDPEGRISPLGALSLSSDIRVFSISESGNGALVADYSRAAWVDEYINRHYPEWVEVWELEFLESEPASAASPD